MMANDLPRQPGMDRRRRKISGLITILAFATTAINIFVATAPAFSQTAAAPKSAPAAAAKDKASPPAKDKSTSPAPAKPAAAAKAKPAKPAQSAKSPTSLGGAPGVHPPTAEEAKRLVKARTLASEGRYDDACNEFRSIIKSNPNCVEAIYWLGYVLGRQGSYVASISYEKHALELDPTNAPAYAVLGLSLGSLHQYSEAAKALRAAIRLQPLAASCYVNLAAIYEKQGDYKGACSLYHRAIAIKPDYAKAYLGLGEALGKLGDKLGSVEACRSAVKFSPKSAMAHAKLGMALSEAGDFGGSVSEGFTANALKVQESWNEFLGTFLAAWGLVFLGFSLIFAVCFAGSRFKPQEGEKVLRSFFLTFYKDQPGRFVVTDSRLVFVPELFSSALGATRVSIQRAQVESIQYLSTMGGGTVSILTRDQSVHQFRMPILVLDPLRSLLVSQALAGLDRPEGEVAPAVSSAESGSGVDSAPESSAEASAEASKDKQKDSAAEGSSDSNKDSSKESSKESPQVPGGDATAKDKSPAVADAVGADAEPEKEPPAPAAPKTIAAELEITEVDSEMISPETVRGEDNKS